MSFELVTLLHLIGVFFLLLSSGACSAFFLSTETTRTAHYHQFMAIHGIGMLGTLVTGLGIANYLGLSFPWPLYVWVKLACWVGIGGSIALASRLQKPRACFIATAVFAALAAFAAVYGRHFHLLL